MKIEGSNLSMYSAMSYEYSHQTYTSAQLHSGISQSQNEGQNKLQNAVAVDFSFQHTQSVSTQRVAYFDEDQMTKEDLLIKLLLERLLGRMYGGDNTTSSQASSSISIAKEVSASLQTSGYSSAYSPQAMNSQPVGALVQTTHEYYQKQTIDFSASIQIQTPNKTFEMDISVSFTQELYEVHSSQFAIGDEGFIDPLVINYHEDVNPFENLSDLKFEFDLDNDGKDDLIPLLKKGAGFLALDRNSNGKIDNGTELFGTESGNGFKDLSVFDKDKNNWIDENDEIFSKLKVWQKDDSNEPKLVSLLDLNIGAIYLGDVQSGFKYQSSIHSTEALQQSNGIFVKEDGSGAGVVSSLDIAV